MYWVSVISELLNIPMETASLVYERMYSFDFSESSDEEIRRYAKLTLLCMKV
jgi:hypothetical protein